MTIISYVLVLTSASREAEASYLSKEDINIRLKPAAVEVEEVDGEERRR